MLKAQEVEKRGQGKPWKAYLLLTTAALTCPCHLPLILAILGGTALAGVLRENLFLTLLGLTAYFMFAIAMGLKLLEREKRRAVKGGRGRPLLGLIGGLLLLSTWQPALGQEVPAEKALTLDDIIEVALARSPRLRAAERQIQAADFGVEIARGTRFGRVEVFSEYLYAGPSSENKKRLIPRTELFSKIPQDEIFAHNTYTGGISFRIPLYTGGKLTAEIRASELVAVLARDRFRQTSDELIFNLSSTYYTILRLREDIKAIEASVKALEEAKKVIEAFVEAKKAPKLDLFKVNTRLAAVRQDLIRLRNQLAIAYGVLNTLMGLEDVTQRFPIAGRLAYTPQAFDLKQSIQEALERRPEYQAQKRAVNIREQQVHIARAQRLPVFELGVRYLGASSDERFFRITDDVTTGVTMSVPIFTGGVLSARVAEAEARLAQSKEQLARVQLDIAQEVQTAYLNITEAEKRIETTKAALEEAQEALRIEQLKLDLGKGTIEFLLDAQAAELEAEANYFRALADYNTSVVALKKAIGAIPTMR